MCLDTLGLRPIYRQESSFHKRILSKKPHLAEELENHKVCLQLLQIHGWFQAGFF